MRFPTTVVHPPMAQPPFAYSNESELSELRAQMLSLQEELNAEHTKRIEAEEELREKLAELGRVKNCSRHNSC